MTTVNQNHTSGNAHSVQANGNVREISLADSSREEWLKLPLAVLRDAGPAAQTLAGVLAISGKETFVSLAAIARRARLPQETAKRHLRILHRKGWIQAKGRCRTRSGVLRRTATVVVTAKTRASLESYGFLPWWAAEVKLYWCAKVVLSVWMARYIGLLAVDKQNENDELVSDRERFRFSLSWLERNTGLSRHSVIRAKRNLNKFGILHWSGLTPKPGFSCPPDFLSVNDRFRVIVTQIGNNRCSLNLKGSPRPRG
jgi:hypothetical protein